MKIGILSSGNDMLTLFSFLQRYDNEYIIWYDDAYFSWGDKPKSLVLDRVHVGLDFLRSKGVELVLVPPVIELLLSGEKGIAPLFSLYAQKCFAGSLIGKIGFFGDWLDLHEGQILLENLAKDYVLVDNQRATKKFSFPFVWWGKEVRNWKYFLDTMSWSHPLVNRIIKQDLRYFKDANVDTLLPLNYSYFHVEKSIHKACNTKRMKFHGIKELEDVFTSLQETSSEYGVSVFCTGHGEFFTREKRLMWLLGRGNKENVKVCLS